MYKATPKFLSLCVAVSVTSITSLASPLSGLPLPMEGAVNITAEFSIDGSVSVLPGSNLTIEYFLKEKQDTWKIYGDAKLEIGNDSDDSGDDSGSGDSGDDSNSDDSDDDSGSDDSGDDSDDDTTPCTTDDGENKDKAADSDGDGSQEIEASFGTADKPGLVITNDTVKQLNVSLMGRFELGKLVVCVPDGDPVNVTYDSKKDQYLLSGELAIQELWSASLMLGTGAQPGIEIDNGNFQLDNITVDVEDVHAGSLTMKKIEVAYSKSQGEVVFEVDLDVAFPPEGMEIDAKVTFDDGVLNDISLSYMATGDEQGIEIGDSGVSIAMIGGKLDNLKQPSELQVTGNIGLEFGGQMSIGGEDLTVLRSNGSIAYTPESLTFKDKVYLGAKETDSTWSGILGEGAASISLDWSAADYSIMGTLNVPAEDTALIVDADLSLNSNGFDFIGDAKVIVPESIPVIGGDTLEEIGAALHSVNGHADASYGAAWTKVITSTVGFKYTFGTKDFSLIGGDTVSDIKHQIESDEDYQIITKSFSLPEGANSLLFRLTFTTPEPQEELAVEFATVKVVNKGLELTNNIEVPGDNILTLTGFSLTSVGGYAPTPLGAVIVGAQPAKLTYHADISQTFIELGSGQAQLVFRYLKSSSPNLKIDLEVTGHYPTPVNTVSEMSTGGSQGATKARYKQETSIGSMTAIANLNYWTHGVLAGNAKIHLYVDDDNQGYNGRPVATNLPYGDHDPVKGGAQQTIWNGRTFHPSGNHAYHFYSVLDDGVNPPILSHYTKAVLRSPPIFGKVFDPVRSISPIANVRIYLDMNNNGRFDHGAEPVTLTNQAGEFAFHEVAQGKVDVTILLPTSYQLDTQASLGQRIITVDYQGNPERVNFAANIKASVGGVIFDDLNRNGTQDSDELGLAGETLFMDKDADGVHDDEEVSAKSNANGQFRFFSLIQGKDYRVTLARAGTVVTNEFVATTPFEQGEINFAVSSTTNSSRGGSVFSGSKWIILLIISGFPLLLSVRAINEKENS